MNINQLTLLTQSKTATKTTSNLTSGQTSTQATSGTSPVLQAMKQADARIQSQLDSTNAQLSSFGKLKSSVSDAQLAAAALSKFTTASSNADIKTAVARFVTTFNTAISTARAAAALPGAVSAESSSAKRVSRDMGRALGANTAVMDALKKMGIKQLADGTLSLDASKLNASQKAAPANLQANLAKIGQLVDKMATRELASGGSVGDSMASLNQRFTNLKTQQSSVLAMAQKLAAYQSSY